MKSIASAPPSRHRLDPSGWVADYREYLIRFALQRISDYGIAEDLVQETFLSAWNARNSFRGDCSERTWLTGVLRNKIIDHYRRTARRPLVLASDFDDQRDGVSQGPWLENRANERDIYDPDAAAERAEMLSLLEEAVGRLPGVMGKAFRMRELQGRSTEEITRALKISKGNLWVLIHRAKQLLKDELQGAWAGGDFEVASDAKLAA